ncbi:MAG: LysM peptidoglycan-binding domain-containing protein [Phycisphaerae bacterium]|nr:LysM peptidoglycan-binding domain-containing protein [Phycisphaerae bacterium]
MSKDYKLGILFGLLVLAAGVVYWVVLDKPEDNPQVQPENQTEKVEIVETTTTTPPATPTVIEERTTVVETPAATVGSAPATPAATTTAAAGTPTRSILNISDTVETTGGGFQLTKGADDVLTADDPIVEPTPIKTPKRVTPNKKGEYIVQKGDNGFSVVSQRIYGTRKYWKLIANANPGVRSTALRVGMKLNYPPQPTEATIPTIAVATRAQGRTYTDAAGRRIYVVAASDTNGFWGIAKKVYKGKGYLHSLIQKANPGVDTTKLKPGMKLVIPPESTAKLATKPKAPESKTRAEPGQIVTIKGKKFYIVKPGDAGFDYIAAKPEVYGSAKYGKLIAKANPNVSSTTLMPRDKLRIPPKPAGPPPGSASSSTRSKTSGRKPQGATREHGRPYFGD